MIRANKLWTLDRILLAIYLVALTALMFFPIGGPVTEYLGIGIDKWLHFLLFGGLAVFVRWNLGNDRHAVLKSIGAALTFAVLTEIGQGLVSYRSAELMDVWAGLIGATIGAVIMNRVVTSTAPQKPIGVMVGTLGVMVGGLFALADIIGIGSSDMFGTVQLAGTALGIIIVAAGGWLYVCGMRQGS